MCQTNCIECFRQGPDLIRFDQDRITDAAFDSLKQTTLVGNEQIIADQLYFTAQFISHQLPAIPVILIEAILHRDNGKAPQQLIVIVHQLGGIKTTVLRLEEIGFLFFVVESTGCGINGDKDLFTWLVTGLFYSHHQQLKGLIVGLQIRAVASLVPHRSMVTFRVEDTTQRVKCLHSHLQSAGERIRTTRHDHEFLNIDIVVRMLTTVEHIHHRYRQYVSVDTTDVLV